MAKKDWGDMTAKEKITGVVTLIIIGVILVVVFSSSSNGSKDKRAATTPRKADLADRVDQELKKQLNVDSYIKADSPFTYINGMTTATDDIVDVNYQTDCDKQQATFVAKQVLGMTGADIKDLGAIVVICTNGTTGNAYREQIFTD